MTITKPIHEATVCGKPLRFFASPLLDGTPDFPWYSVDDLQRCVGLSSREEREFFLRMLREFRGLPVRTIATPDGPVTLSPHCAALGMIEAFQDLGRAPANTKREYASEAKKACDKLPGAAGQDFEWIIAAFKRWD